MESRNIETTQGRVYESGVVIKIGADFDPQIVMEWSFDRLSFRTLLLAHDSHEFGLDFSKPSTLFLAELRMDSGCQT